ncbi:hypothetical protein HETIRDRAFT_475616 [Heterobasidion irregulare TC 32-1]|uniref:Uncharacterized protein n=1 Tax=Heterobasidion irregulare (strain TC 32-1) TaxID=747525 RepID=W4K8R4_HETIT|nr:uncharacterized protein HETIRDRAFT_475616 [Heterobasidion irregulare TC 32-1]ETW82144.1 hypothetical protein HETIRDRAFT_475616 [Heterobasidion irregulare TC 32-1]
MHLEPFSLQSNPARLFSVEGAIAVITGGGTGIGLMMATALEHNGATVYIVGRRLAVLEQVAKERSRHGKLIPVQCDVTSRESLGELASMIRKRHGYINLLVCNAGIAAGFNKPPARGDKRDIRALQESLWNGPSPQDFARTFETNVTSVYYCVVAFLDLLHEANVRSSGKDPVTSQVITVSSVAALRRDERQYSYPYTLSKAASLHLGKMFTNVLSEWKIRSNVICPGIFPSEMTSSVIPDEHIMNDVPLQRAGDQQDIAGIILFLASRAGAYVDGTVHITDGGRLSTFPSTY